MRIVQPEEMGLNGRLPIWDSLTTCGTPPGFRSLKELLPIVFSTTRAFTAATVPKLQHQQKLKKLYGKGVDCVVNLTPRITGYGSVNTLKSARFDIKPWMMRQRPSKNSSLQLASDRSNKIASTSTQTWSYVKQKRNLEGNS